MWKLPALAQPYEWVFHSQRKLKISKDATSSLVQPSPLCSRACLSGPGCAANVNGEAEPPSPPFSPGLLAVTALFTFTTARQRLTPAEPISSPQACLTPAAPIRRCCPYSLALSLFESKVCRRPSWGGSLTQRSALLNLSHGVFSTMGNLRK